ncbi:hypothetical protein [Spirochaeta lutea]|uniref:Cobalt transporter n=1 Tax=Spirochaeta lutea TaxID=1480694 RepID=A0A098QWH9_9SPIO|nr:hypothetical protein [Spirochaeta lutea]KGE72235.1 hypothetical protein DC28_07605 [Spirochaeta lutea]
MNPTLMHVKPGRGTLYRSDPRLLLPLYIVSNILLYLQDLGWLLASLLLILGAYLGSRLSMKAFFRELGVFWVLILFTLISSLFASLTQQSWVLLIQGTTTALRLLVSIALANLFMSVVSARAIRDTLLWYIRPVSVKTAIHTSLAVSIMIAAIPGLLDALETSRAAIRMRGINPLRHPLSYTLALAIQALVQVQLFVEHTELAVRARGFHPDDPPSLNFFQSPTSTEQNHGFCGKDALVLTGWLIFLIVALVVG